MSNSKKIKIWRSSSWWGDDITLIREILDDVINSLGEKDTVINIEKKQEYNISRFWVYFIEGE
jgi:hypothetical protein